MILRCVNVLLCNMTMYPAIRTVIKYVMNILCMCLYRVVYLPVSAPFLVEQQFWINLDKKLIVCKVIYPQQKCYPWICKADRQCVWDTHWKRFLTSRL